MSQRHVKKCWVRPSSLGQLSASKSVRASHILMIERGRTSHVFIFGVTFSGMLWRIMSSLMSSPVLDHVSQLEHMQHPPFHITLVDLVQPPIILSLM